MCGDRCSASDNRAQQLDCSRIFESLETLYERILYDGEEQTTICCYEEARTLQQTYHSTWYHHHHSSLSLSLSLLLSLSSALLPRPPSSFRLAPASRYVFFGNIESSISSSKMTRFPEANFSKG